MGSSSSSRPRLRLRSRGVWTALWPDGTFTLYSTWPDGTVALYNTWRTRRRRLRWRFAKIRRSRVCQFLGKFCWSQTITITRGFSRVVDLSCCLQAPPAAASVADRLASPGRRCSYLKNWRRSILNLAWHCKRSVPLRVFFDVVPVRPASRPGGAPGDPWPASRPGGAPGDPWPASRPGGAPGDPWPASRPGGAPGDPWSGRPRALVLRFVPILSLSLSVVVVWSGARLFRFCQVSCHVARRAWAC
jgi:hypothetical protein